MASTSETGHAKNAANFSDLLSFVKSYGTAYNPSKAALKVNVLQSLLNKANNAINDVNAAIPAYSNAVSAREAAFSPLNKLITRVINALKATDANDQVIENAKSLAKKLQGNRVSAKLSEVEKKALAAQGKEQKEISSSQMSYDNRLDNFDKLIKLLESIPQYTPNEKELQVATLTSLYNSLKAKNTAVVNASVPLSNARITRNEVMYQDKTGMHYIAGDVKTYIKSLYGATSPQYKQVSGLKFTKPR